jgi:hypothetical protein
MMTCKAANTLVALSLYNLAPQESQLLSANPPQFNRKPGIQGSFFGSAPRVRRLQFVVLFLLGRHLYGSSGTIGARTDAARSLG